MCVFILVLFKFMIYNIDYSVRVLLKAVQSVLYCLFYCFLNLLAHVIDLIGATSFLFDLKLNKIVE